MNSLDTDCIIMLKHNRGVEVAPLFPMHFFSLSSHRSISSATFLHVFFICCSRTHLLYKRSPDYKPERVCWAQKIVFDINPRAELFITQTAEPQNFSSQRDIKWNCSPENKQHTEVQSARLLNRLHNPRRTWNRLNLANCFYIIN